MPMYRVRSISSPPKTQLRHSSVNLPSPPPSSSMNTIKLQRKYPQFSQEEIFGLINTFNKLDVDEKGYIAQQTAVKSLEYTGSSYDDIRATLKECNVDASGRIEIDDYVELNAKLKDGKSKKSYQVSAHKIKVTGSSANVSHTINEDERREFTRHINSALAGDKDIGERLPFPPDTMQIFDECKDGLVLSKLINDAVPDTIDDRVLNKSKGKPINSFQMTENNNIVVMSAKAIGCSVVNIGAQDIIEGREILILGLIWQIIRRGLLSKIDIKVHPELYRLLLEDETLDQFLRLPPEQILLRWFNYHLTRAGWHRKVNNFSKDVSDAENYTVLLNQLNPAQCSLSPLQNRDILSRAEQVLQNADLLGCRKYLTPSSLVAGNPKLNLAFVAHLFNTHPCLAPLEENERPEIEDFDAEGEREARVFTLWLNSLDVQPGVHSLFDDLRDGTILLQAFDKVLPGSVTWKYVNKPSGKPIYDSEGELSPLEMSRFKAVENSNYVVSLGKQYHFSLVGIQGADITDGQKTLTLALVWQLMRTNIVKTLQSLSRGGRDIADTDILKWANDQVRNGGKSTTARSFKDASLKTGVFLLDCLNGIKKGYVDYDIVTAGRTDEEAYNNAKLAISIARKLGAAIFLVPEDIVQVRSRLILTFVGSLMAVA